ncbi:MAG: hypothetical protein M3O34_05525 [Chloroflexota bacterium]|nr:hypothetical protein [Chloroflexota bacterium]
MASRMAWTTALGSMSCAELIAQDIIVTGTPDSLVDRFDHFHHELGMGHLMLQGHESRMDRATTTRRSS